MNTEQNTALLSRQQALADYETKLRNQTDATRNTSAEERNTKQGIEEAKILAYKYNYDNADYFEGAGIEPIDVDKIKSAKDFYTAVTAKKAPLNRYLQTLKKDAPPEYDNAEYDDLVSFIEQKKMELDGLDHKSNNQDVKDKIALLKEDISQLENRRNQMLGFTPSKLPPAPAPITDGLDFSGNSNMGAKQVGGKSIPQPSSDQNLTINQNWLAPSQGDTDKEYIYPEMVMPQGVASLSAEDQKILAGLSKQILTTGDITKVNVDDRLSQKGKAIAAKLFNDVYFKKGVK
jgi:hypothetical protein